MTLVKRKNGPNSRSYRVTWNGNKSWITIGTCDRYDEKAAREFDRMIMSLVATKRIGQSFDSKQIDFLDSVDDKVHSQLEREGLARERAAQRAHSAYHLEKVIGEYRNTRKDPYGTSKVLDASFTGLLNKFGGTKDIRDISRNEAKAFPQWLKRNGRLDGKGKLADSTVSKRIERVKSFFLWAVGEEIVPHSVFAHGVRTNSGPMKDRQHLVTLKESEMLLESQDNLQNFALAVLARFLGVRPAADCLWLRNRDVVFAGGDCSRAEITLDSVKTGSRKCPLFCDAVYIVLKLLCDREPKPDGFLIKGSIWDRIRDPHDDADTGSLNLSVQFGRRYSRKHGQDLWQKPFVNTRSTVITELSKFYGYNQHSIGVWLGNTPGIQNQHYLQIMNDDHRDAMRKWHESKKGSSKGSRTDGSHLSAMVFRALRKVCPELVPAAEKHAAGITKIGLNEMFESAEVPLGEKPSVQSRGGPSSGGGTRTPDTRIMIPVL
jgi:hypothetical protein